MTELDLYYQCIPDIAEMIVDQRERTQEQRMQWNKGCIEYAKNLSPFVYGFIRKTLMVIDNYLKKDEDHKMVRIDDIKIFPCCKTALYNVLRLQIKISVLAPINAYSYRL